MLAEATLVIYLCITLTLKTFHFVQSHLSSKLENIPPFYFEEIQIKIRTAIVPIVLETGIGDYEPYIRFCPWKVKWAGFKLKELACRAISMILSSNWFMVVADLGNSNFLTQATSWHKLPVVFVFKICLGGKLTYFAFGNKTMLLLKCSHLNGKISLFFPQEA